jgi:hypothetical protein
MEPNNPNIPTFDASLNSNPEYVGIMFCIEGERKPYGTSNRILNYGSVPDAVKDILTKPIFSQYAKGHKRCLIEVVPINKEGTRWGKPFAQWNSDLENLWLPE